MYIAIVESKYDYQMSYLDEWRSAWERVASRLLNVNLANGKGLNTLKKELKSIDLIVVLHSATADSNLWLSKLTQCIDKVVNCRIVLFVGNEFSSPWLSTSKRLENIINLSPSLIATQLDIQTANWLYDSTKAKIVSAPPGIPKFNYNSENELKPIDFSYRGFVYPWYLLDNERNLTVASVLSEAEKLQLKIDYTQSARLGKQDWMKLLSNSKLTASSEAGSRFVFNNDNVWSELLDYLSIGKRKFTNIPNDSNGMSLMRKFPTPLKSFLRKIARLIGVNQGSLYKPSNSEEEVLLKLVHPEEFEYRNGKCISSRHMDAIACRTWQILTPGSYNGILQEGIHYSRWQQDGLDKTLILALNSQREGNAEIAYQDLIKKNSYDARVLNILASLE